MAKSLGYFLKLQQVLYKFFFFVLAKSYSISPVCLQRSTKKALFLAFLKGSTDHLFDNLESGKINYCCRKKSLQKVLNFGSKKSVRTLY